jgi:hypothetical protein
MDTTALLKMSNSVLLGKYPTLFSGTSKAIDECRSLVYVFIIRAHFLSLFYILSPVSCNRKLIIVAFNDILSFTWWLLTVLFHLLTFPFLLG